jgi:hypothetical protein
MAVVAGGRVRERAFDQLLTSAGGGPRRREASSVGYRAFPDVRHHLDAALTVFALDVPVLAPRRDSHTYRQSPQQNAAASALMRYSSGRLDAMVSRSSGHHRFDATAVLGAVKCSPHDERSHERALEWLRPRVPRGLGH